MESIFDLLSVPRLSLAPFVGDILTARLTSLAVDSTASLAPPSPPFQIVLIDFLSWIEKHLSTFYTPFRASFASLQEMPLFQDKHLPDYLEYYNRAFCDLATCQFFSSHADLFKSQTLFIASLRHLLIDKILHLYSIKYPPPPLPSSEVDFLDKEQKILLSAICF
jgi:hypothetical protein